MKKKILLCVVAFVAAACLVSCADIFSGSGQDGVTITIPAFSRASNASRAASTDRTYSRWNVYAFLVSRNADSTVLEAIHSVLQRYSLDDMKEAAANPGILQAVSYKGVDFSHDVPVKFQRIKPGTEYFVLLLVTYASDGKDETIVFSGMSPQNALGENADTNTYFVAACHTVQSGVNAVALSLKKNARSNVYFVNNSTSVAGTNTSGNGTPSNPCSFPSNANGVIILTEDVTCESLDITNSSATIMSLPGKACTLTVQDAKNVSRELNIGQSGSLELIDVTLVASKGEVNQDGVLRVGGAVRIVLRDKDEAYIKLKKDDGRYSKVSIVSPPERAAGKKICTIKIPENKDRCDLTKYFKGDFEPTAYFNIIFQ